MKNKFSLKGFVTIGLSFLAFAGIISQSPAMASGTAETVSTYLVLSSIGRYQGQAGQNVSGLFLENAVKYDAPVGSDLPGRDKVTTIESSQGVFASWVRYDGLGAPTKYSKVPKENGAILYANFVNSHLSLVSLSLSGTPTKTSYDLDQSENVFNPSGLTITATFSDQSTLNVTSSVVWQDLVVGMTSIVGSYSFSGVTKTVTVTGITVTGTSALTRISLNAGGSSLWDQAGAWFGAYCWSNSGNAWYVMNKANTLYVADIDTDAYQNIIFVRFADTATVASWENASVNIWNQTTDLTFGGNCYTITGWNSSDGAWSTI